MDYTERAKILSKEALTSADIANLCEISVRAAQDLMLKIKFKVGDRLGIKGRLHTLDYFRWLNLDNEPDGVIQRYRREETEDPTPGFLLPTARRDLQSSVAANIRKA